MHTGILTKEMAGTLVDDHELLARKTVPSNAEWAPMKKLCPTVSSCSLMTMRLLGESGRGWGHWP